MSIPVHFRGVVLGPSGFAAQGREWLALLEYAGLQPSLEGALLGETRGGESAADRALLGRCAARPFRPGSVTVHHMLVPHFRPDPRAVANVLLTVFETESLPPGWADLMKSADAVVVPTDFNRRSFARGGMDPRRLHVIPVPVATYGFRPGVPPSTALPERRPGIFRFLSVFDWSMRKGVDVLLPAFARTFTAAEAELVLKVAPHRLGRERLQDICRRTMRTADGERAPEVHVCDALLSTDQLPGLYAAADAFVLPSRGEGWGRPVHEAMLMCLPVVASRAGALATLLADDTVGYPVPGRTVPVDDRAVNETPMFAGQEWHEPNAAALGARMREVYANREEAARRARRAREHVLALCNHRSIADSIRQVLSRPGAGVSGARQ